MMCPKSVICDEKTPASACNRRIQPSRGWIGRKCSAKIVLFTLSLRYSVLMVIISRNYDFKSFLIDVQRVRNHHSHRSTVFISNSTQTCFVKISLTSYRNLLFIFLLDAAVLNAFILWGWLYPDSKLTHAEFQHQIAEAFLLEGATRKRSSAVSILSSKEEDNSSSCEWKHLSKKTYYEPCRKQGVELRKRRALEEISENPTKRQRTNRKELRSMSNSLYFQRLESVRISTRSRRIRRRWCKK